jgi:hypothetical protein
MVDYRFGYLSLAGRLNIGRVLDHFLTVFQFSQMIGATSNLIVNQPNSLHVFINNAPSSVLYEFCR